MRGHRSSLLVRITDFLWTPYTSLGGLLGFAPTHHIVMENIMYGKDLDTQGDKWETYDLKPTSFFYPERDILEGALTSQATKDKLVDDFDDKIRITEAQFNDLLSVLEADTAFLEKHNAVDYSLFLVRFPASANIEYLDQKKTIWGEGIESTDKQWKYRVVLLDFFWAKHKLQAKAMTGLINSYNVIGRHGPMSITTTPKDYRDRFLKMVRGFIEVIEPSR